MADTRHCSTVPRSTRPAASKDEPNWCTPAAFKCASKSAMDARSTAEAAVVPAVAEAGVGPGARTAATGSGSSKVAGSSSLAVCKPARAVSAAWVYVAVWALGTPLAWSARADKRAMLSASANAASAS
ncbi:Uncharacterised protein [uncultured archaeon]|nr:Uncharacterised protein [uncultured archaeon]